MALFLKGTGCSLNCRVSNTIAQTFLQPILEHSLDSHVRVRAAALNTLGLIQRQGLMHPLQVPCLHFSGHL